MPRRFQPTRCGRFAASVDVSITALLAECMRASFALWVFLMLPYH